MGQEGLAKNAGRRPMKSSIATKRAGLNGPDPRFVRDSELSPTRTKALRLRGIQL
jgi:hypothetical protein